MLNVDIDKTPETKNFKVDTINFAESDYKEKVLECRYPHLYILENGKDAYIGITGNIEKRIDQHLSDKEKAKYQFTSIHLITGDDSEFSPVFHYESILIRLMRLDEKFNIINHYNGLEINHYGRKNKFEIYFDRLWLELEKKNLVHTKDFQVILNNNAYKYSPFVLLNKEQEKALTSIINSLDSEDTLPDYPEYHARPIMVTGSAGTGKTVVATSLLYHLKLNKRYQNKRIALVIACTTLRKELQKVVRQNNLPGNCIISPTEVTHIDKKTNKLCHYDILICDEAHKLRRMKNLYMYANAFTKANTRLGLDNTYNELDWLLQQTDKLVLFYDERQNTSPCDVTGEYFKEKIFNERLRGIKPIEKMKLVTQMRVEAGEDYVSYVYKILNQETTTKQTFDRYSFGIFTSFRDLVNAVREKESQYGLSRLCGGYGWEWKTEKDPSLFDITMDGSGVKWNSTRDGWLTNLDLKEEMGSGYTLQGFDLNYAGVVFGPEIYFDESTHEIKINRELFYDKTLKKGSDDKQLKDYALNTYAVLLTRAIKGTFIYVCNDSLRKYLNNFIDIIC